MRVRWLPITPEAYAAVFASFDQGRWSCFLSYTRPREDREDPRPGDQRTEWGLRDQGLALLANQTDGGVHRYYIAQAVPEGA